MTVPTITDDLLAEIEAATKAVKEVKQGYCEGGVFIGGAGKCPKCSATFQESCRRPFSAIYKNPNTILALIARVRELEKDAGRYRWLRDRALDVEFTAPAVVMVNEKCKPKTGEVWSSAMRGEEMDTALDEAMQGDK